ncbi:MAG: hypothetical protein HWE14_03380 [Flavobacteriia bacterium]|nr:hypothetical protein [Flavobacteriia bacterium]
MSSQNKLILDLSESIISLSNFDTEKDFVAISCEVNKKGECFHSGLVICFNNELKYFHYTGIKVELITLDSSELLQNHLLFKITEIIHKSEVSSFLGHCEVLLERGVKPKYGFVFDGSYYDPVNQEHFLQNAQHDFTTCVGFCIKVIRGHLYNNDEYLSLKDWEEIPLEKLSQEVPGLVSHMENEIQRYIQDSGTSRKELFASKHIKRILPIEILCSAFFLKLPIRKQQIQDQLPELQAEISKRVA